MVDDQYTMYERQDGLRMSIPVPDQFDIFLWLVDYFCLNKGKAGQCLMRHSQVPHGRSLVTMERVRLCEKN